MLPEKGFEKLNLQYALSAYKVVKWQNRSEKVYMRSWENYVSFDSRNLR